MLKELLSKLKSICEERYHFNRSVYTYCLQEKEPLEFFNFYLDFLCIESQKVDLSPAVHRDTIHSIFTQDKTKLISCVFLEIKFYDDLIKKIKEIESLLDNDDKQAQERLISLHFDVHIESVKNERVRQNHAAEFKEKYKKGKHVKTSIFSNYLKFKKEKCEDNYIEEIRALLFPILVVEEQAFIKTLLIEFDDKEKHWYKFDPGSYLSNTIVPQIESLEPEFSPEASLLLEKIDGKYKNFQDNLKIKMAPLKAAQSDELIIATYRSAFYDMYSLCAEIDRDIKAFFRSKKKQKINQTAEAHESLMSPSELKQKEEITTIVDTEVSGMSGASKAKEEDKEISEASDNPKPVVSLKDQKPLLKASETAKVPESPGMLHSFKRQCSKKHQKILDLLGEKILPAIRYEELLNLITHLGGKIIRSNGSHRTIELLGIRGGVFQPHKEPSKACTELFRSLISRAGLLASPPKHDELKKGVKP